MKTAEQLITEHIVREIVADNPEYDWPTGGTASELLDFIVEDPALDCALQDAMYDFRRSGEEQYWPCQANCYSRHYESDLVVRELSDGVWVGWIYWHGGGKHGDPGSIDWLDDARVLKVASEKEIVMKVRTFEIAGD